MFRDPHLHHRRASREEVVLRKSVGPIIGPVQRDIARWYQQVAHLRALRNAGRDRQMVALEAARIAPLVVAARINLEAELHHQEQAVATHSLIRDVQRALLRLSDELEQLLNLERTDGDVLDQRHGRVSRAIELSSWLS
jgi:hypothetical protein